MRRVVADMLECRSDMAKAPSSSTPAAALSGSKALFHRPVSGKYLSLGAVPCRALAAVLSCGPWGAAQSGS